MDWTKAKPGVPENVSREGTVYLDAQLRLATSADQRAAVLAGIFTTASTALLAGLVALSTSSAPGRLPIFLGGGTAVVLFVAAAAFCIVAIFPVGFWLPGSEPKSWKTDVEEGKDLVASLGQAADHIQEKIEENRCVLDANAKRFKWGATLGIAAPLVGTVVWIVGRQLS